MPFKITVIKPNGEKDSLTQPKSPDLKQLQGAVEGLIETVPHLVKFEGRNCEAYCNEEGRLHNLPLNPEATKVWLSNLGRGPFRYEPQILGNLVLV